MLPRVSFRLSVPLVIFFGLAWAALVALYGEVSQPRQEVIKFAAELLGGATAVYALFMNVQSVRNAAARRFIERWTDPNFATFRKAISDMVDAGSPAHFDKQTLLAILNFWEEIAIAVLSREADERLLNDFFYTTVLKCFKVTQKWVEDERTRRNQPTGYIQFEKLYNRWKPK